MHPREHNSKHSIYHQWCALPTKEALVKRSPYILPRYKFLDLPRDVIRNVTRFRLYVYTLQIKSMTWTHNTFPTCDLCNANDIQDEEHVLFHCTHPPVVSLRRNCAPPFHPAGFNNVSVFSEPEQFFPSFMHL